MFQNGAPYTPAVLDRVDCSEVNAPATGKSGLVQLEPGSPDWSPPPNTKNFTIRVNGIRAAGTPEGEDSFTNGATFTPSQLVTGTLENPVPLADGVSLEWETGGDTTSIVSVGNRAITINYDFY